MNRNFVTLLVVLFLVPTLFACQSASTPTAVPTAMPLPELTPTAIPTDAPIQTPTYTPAPTEAPTYTPMPTATPVPIPVISGLVTDVLNGQGIAGAKVEVRPVGCCFIEWEYSTTTGADGSYALFDDLPLGDYLVRVTASDYAREYWDNVVPSEPATSINISSGRNITGIDFVLTEGSAISGHIYQNDGTTPIAEANVFVRPSQYRSDDGFWTVTDAEGAYKVEGLPLGDFKITSDTPGYARLRYYNGAEGVYDWSNGVDVKVVPPATVTDVNISLHLGSSISGHVYQSDGMTPFANANVNGEERAFPLEGFDTVANSDGYYFLEDLPPGNFVISAKAQGFANRWYDSQSSSCNVDRLTLAEGESLTDIDFALETAVPLRGYVYDEEGTPISGLAVIANFGLCGQPANMTDTNSMGAYELWLGAGSYYVNAGWNEAPTYVFEWYNGRYHIEDADLVHLEAPDGTSGIDFHLTKSGSISGYVYEADGTTPISDASVYAYSVAGNHPGSGVNTEPDGSYTITGLPSGTYTIQATVSGHVAAYYNNALDSASATAVRVNAPDDTPGIDFLLSPVSD